MMHADMYAVRKWPRSSYHYLRGKVGIKYGGTARYRIPEAGDFIQVVYLYEMIDYGPRYSYGVHDAIMMKRKQEKRYTKGYIKALMRSVGYDLE